ncbi:MAG: hypothetical protein NWE89_11530 [Candidatus Bathyarchaeota archaeon]|nr:hypothetical protein [Candidatus Bathyarchaeota archaeon]
MAAFPTLYIHGTLVHTPVVGRFEDTMAQNPTIRSQFEGGYVQTRSRFTRIARRWTVSYRGMSQANKNTLRTFENARRAGSELFTWTNPEDSTSYNVRFLEPVIYTPWEHTNFLQWNIDFVLEQV